MERTENKDLYAFGPFILNASDRVLLNGGQEVKLGSRAIDVLHYFVNHPNSLLSRNQFLLAVWKAKNFDPSVVDGKIKEVRDALDRCHPRVEYIRTQRGQGWRFVVPVEKLNHLTATALASTKGSPAKPIEAEIPVDPVEYVADSFARPVTALRKNWSWRVYGAVIASLGISAGAAVIIKGMHGAEPCITGYRQLSNDGFPKEGRLLTDGRLIYFSEHVSHDANSDVRLATVPSSGGEVEYPPTPLREAALIDIAREAGDRLFFRTNSIDGGSLFLWQSREMSLESTGLNVNQASISPDGRTLAYGDSHHNLCVRDLSSSSAVRAIPVGGDVQRLRWSIDGKRIRFSVNENLPLSASLWDVRRDGSGLHQLPIPAMKGERLWSEGWTADGRYFTFSKNGQLDRRTSLWIVPDGPLNLKQPVRLTNVPMDFREATVSSDNSVIFAIGTKSHSEVARFDLEKHLFVPFWVGVPAIDISFSKDRAWAAYARYPESTLWVSRADGSERRQITWAGIEVHQPHWSPDGRMITFMGQKPGKLWRIYIVDAAGGVPQEVKPDDPFDQGVPSWSADGRSLVFGELRYRKSDADMVIRILNLATGKETILPGSKGKWSPRWSPDGSHILAQTTDFKEIDLFDCTSQRWTPLARVLSDDATWSADGRFVHFRGNIGRGLALFRVRVKDGKIEELVPQPELEYWWSGVAPDGSPLTVRAVKIEEIYALDLKLP